MGLGFAALSEDMRPGAVTAEQWVCASGRPGCWPGSACGCPSPWMRWTRPTRVLRPRRPGQHTGGSSAWDRRFVGSPSGADVHFRKYCCDIWKRLFEGKKEEITRILGVANTLALSFLKLLYALEFSLDLIFLCRICSNCCEFSQSAPGSSCFRPQLGNPLRNEGRRSARLPCGGPGGWGQPGGFGCSPSPRPPSASHVPWAALEAGRAAGSPLLTDPQRARAPPPAPASHTRRRRCGGPIPSAEGPAVGRLPVAPGARPRAGGVPAPSRPRNRLPACSAPARSPARSSPTSKR